MVFAGMYTWISSRSAFEICKAGVHEQKSGYFMYADRSDPEESAASIPSNVLSVESGNLDAESGSEEISNVAKMRLKDVKNSQGISNSVDAQPMEIDFSILWADTYDDNTENFHVGMLVQPQKLQDDSNYDNF